MAAVGLAVGTRRAKLPRGATWLSMLGAKVTGYSLPDDDVRDLGRLRDAMAAAKPEIVFHLAAQALVRASYDDPIATLTTNLNGTVNLLEALRGTPSARAATATRMWGAATARWRRFAIF